jgi:phage tail sheath protein FI
MPGGSLTGGVDDNDLSIGELTAAYALYLEPEVVDVTLVMGGAGNTTVSRYIIDNITSVRKDCIALVSPRRASVVNPASNSAAVAALEVDNTTLGSSSYAVMDGAWKYQYDRYNDVFTYVPMNGDMAGLCARTDFTNDAWWRPAGYNRGTIKNIVKLSWEANKANRDVLYQIGVNPLITPRGAGVLLFGDKTMQVLPSAFDRINVRRLFIVLEKAIAIAAKALLFEFNDEFTRAQFVNIVSPFLRDVQGRRGITDFKVVCDSSNNTGQVIDTNNFVGDIYIKPARSINFIQLNFIAARTDVSFSEIGG